MRNVVSRRNEEIGMFVNEFGFPRVEVVDTTGVGDFQSPAQPSPGGGFLAARPFFSAFRRFPVVSPDSAA
jgi:sugar/nucleoside kinase (ribokinase family)